MYIVYNLFNCTLYKMFTSVLCNALTFTSAGPALGIMTFVLQGGWSSLHEASFQGHLDIVKTLIKAGANVNQTSEVQCLGRYLWCVCIFVASCVGG